MSELTAEELEELRTRVLASINKARKHGTADCGGCGREVTVVRASRCYYCGLWFCHACGKDHFARGEDHERLCAEIKNRTDEKRDLIANYEERFRELEAGVTHWEKCFQDQVDQNKTLHVDLVETQAALKTMLQRCPQHARFDASKQRKRFCELAEMSRV